MFHTWQLLVILSIAGLSVIAIIASIGSWVENERMRKDPSYMPNKDGIFPYFRKNH